MTALEPTAPEPTVAALLEPLRNVHDRGLKFEDEFVPWADHLDASRRRAAVLHALLDADRPLHVGILLDNVPEFSYLVAAAAMHGFVVVGLNSTRRGVALARDVAVSDCQLVLTDSDHSELLDAVPASVPIVHVDKPEWADAISNATSEVTAAAPDADDLLMLIFTSGTSGDPKAVRCTQGKIAAPGRMLATRFGLGPSDTAYISMPMFHSNAMMAGWAVGVAAGGSVALRRRFSASGFVPDARTFGATYANYVGKPLSFVLATPEHPDDADNPLRVVYGNEGRPDHITEFARRFGVTVVDGFGSTEGGVAIARTADTPPAALGKLLPGTEIRDVETGALCPVARFDNAGAVLNPTEATGELVTVGRGQFRGYYNDPEADAERLRGGDYHSGDLAYRDSDGFAYFAGRHGDWLRVDGENLGTSPIERVLLRHPGIRDAVVYPVPDESVGDKVMAAVVADADFDPSTFDAFLSDQADLGPKQWPSVLRVTDAFPRTATFKVVKRTLSAEGTSGPDPVWIRSPAGTYVTLDRPLDRP